MLSPAREAEAVLQRYRDALDKANSTARAERDLWRAALAEQAVLVEHYAQALAAHERSLAEVQRGKVHRHLRILKDQMLDALARHGVEVVVPDGALFEDVLETVRVDGWRHDARFEAEVVAEVREPIVMHCGEIIRLGRVIMGGPPQPSVEVPVSVGESPSPAAAPQAAGQAVVEPDAPAGQPRVVAEAPHEAPTAPVDATERSRTDASERGFGLH